jgi:hypothetical protein
MTNSEKTHAPHDVVRYIEDTGARGADGRFTVDATTTKAHNLIVGYLTPFQELSPDDPRRQSHVERDGRGWSTISHVEKYTPKTGTPEFHAWQALKHCKSEIVGPAQWRVSFDAEGMRHLKRWAFGETAIRVNLDNDTITLGPESHPVTHDQAGIVDRLLKENGGWVPSKNMGFHRADRIIDRMPDSVKQRIESKTGAGYRIHI